MNLIWSFLFHTLYYHSLKLFHDNYLEEQKAALRVISVDYNVTTNAKQHSTDLYEITREHEIEGNYYPPQLVVRRGQSFDVTVQTDRPYNAENDCISLVFDVGMYFARMC